MSDGGFPIRLQQRIGEILAPLDLDGRATHPWQELYTRLVRTKSPTEHENSLRDALGATLTALGHVHRHPRPEYAHRLRLASDRLARLGGESAERLTAIPPAPTPPAGHVDSLEIYTHCTGGKAIEARAHHRCPSGRRKTT